MKRSAKGFKILTDQAFLSSLAITVTLSLVWVWMLYQVMESGEIHSFDPYGILGVDSGADTKAIKK